MGIEELSVGRKRAYKISFDHLMVERDEHLRKDYGDLDPLAEDLAKNGQKLPLIVRIQKVVQPDETLEERAFVSDGVRRLKAMYLANEKFDGHFTDAFCIAEEKKLDKSLTAEERIVLQMSCNSGLPLNQLEHGEGFKRLQKAGWNITRIAEETAKSRAYINDCLRLAEAPEHLKKQVREKKLKPTAAVKALKAGKEATETTMLQTDLAGKGPKGKDIPKGKTEKPKDAKTEIVSMAAFGAGLEAQGFHRITGPDDPKQTGNAEVRLFQKDPPFGPAVYVL